MFSINGNQGPTGAMGPAAPATLTGATGPSTTFDMTTISTVTSGIYSVSPAISTVGAYLGDPTVASNVSTIGSIALQSQTSGTNYLLTKTGSSPPAWISAFYTGQVTLDNGTGGANTITLPAAYSSTSYNVFVTYLGSGTLTPMYVTITDTSHFTINGGTAGVLVCWMTIGT
jgi:hypothetical protein